MTDYDDLCKRLHLRAGFNPRQPNNVKMFGNADDKLHCESHDAISTLRAQVAALQLAVRDDAKWAQELEAAEADNAALRRFAGECLEPWPECLYDIDGEMQNRLHHAGLIEERIADHHGDDHEIGDTVFFLTDAGKAAIDAAIAKEKP